jgi:hypothetical protein
VSIFSPEATGVAEDEDGCFNFESGATIVAFPLCESGTRGGLIERGGELGSGLTITLNHCVFWWPGAVGVVEAGRCLDDGSDTPTESAANGLSAQGMSTCWCWWSGTMLGLGLTPRVGMMRVVPPVSQRQNQSRREVHAVPAFFGVREPFSGSEACVDVSFFVVVGGKVG